MAYNIVPTVVTGQLWSASDQNTYLRDNLAAGAPGIFSAKGDLIVATGVRASMRLPVGGNGRVLMADSSQAGGVKWEAIQFPPQLGFTWGNWTNADWDGSQNKPVGQYSFTPSEFHPGLPGNIVALIVSISARWASATDASRVNVTPSDWAQGNGILVRALIANRFIDNMGLTGLGADGKFTIEVFNAQSTGVVVEVRGYLT